MPRKHNRNFSRLRFSSRNDKACRQRLRLLDTATAGPRTVPVRSGLSGVKTLGWSRIPRPSDVLRAGTARAPVVVSRCAPVYLPDGDYQIVDVMLVTHLEVSARNGARKPR